MATEAEMTAAINKADMRFIIILFLPLNFRILARPCALSSDF
jgi:hypothetical protein